MENLSIECQVTKLCGAAQEKFSKASNPQSIRCLWTALSTDLKAIAGASCYPVIDRGVEALQRAALWDNPYSANDAVRSIVACVANDEIERASIKFNRAIVLELLEVQNG